MSEIVPVTFLEVGTQSYRASQTLLTTLGFPGFDRPLLALVRMSNILILTQYH